MWGDLEIPPGWSVHLEVEEGVDGGKAESVTWAERGDACALLRLGLEPDVDLVGDDGMEDDDG